MYEYVDARGKVLSVNHLHRIGNFGALKFLRNLGAGGTDVNRLFLLSRRGWLGL